MTQPLNDGKGEAVGIQPRNDGEESLLRTGALQTAIFNSANFSSIATDAAGVIQIFNVGAERMLGYTAAEVVNRITPADISDSQEVIARAISLSNELGTLIAPGFEALVFKATRGIEDIYELTYIRKDGTRIPAIVSVTALRDGRDSIIGYLLIGTDNTVRKEALAEVNRIEQALNDKNEELELARRSEKANLVKSEFLEALRESEERFQFVARVMSDGVWDWKRAEDTIWWNDGFLTTFGFSKSEVSSEVAFWEDRIHPDDRARVLGSLNEAVDTGAESWNSEYRFLRKDGNYAFVMDRGFILRDAAGFVHRMVGGIQDVTNQKKIEANKLRTQRMESIGTLAGGIAHDLNNILTPILLSIELLKRGGKNDARTTKFLDVIYTSSQRGADLVRQVLSFAGGGESQQVAVRLQSLIRDIEGLMRGTFPRNIQIDFSMSEDLWAIMADTTQIHQVLLNLAVNARDAMPEGGTLTFRASNVLIDRLYAGTLHAGIKTGSYVAMELSDTGSGIPSEIQERIFEPFFTTKEVGKGTGIGLATAHAIIKEHGGFINVYSEVGKGSSFHVHLPADKSLLPQGPEDAFNIGLPQGMNELILVVDDEATIRDITRQTLEDNGYRVVTACDGNEAVNLYSAQPGEIHAVLTDMMMPIMDGPATIVALKAINPEARIIAASGLGTADNIEKAKNAGVYGFLPKPYSAEALLTLLRHVLTGYA